MRVINFCNGDAVAKTLSWTADVDVILKGADGAATGAGFGYNPDVSASAGASSGNGVFPNEPVLFYSGFSGGVHDFAFPLLQGQVIYCNLTATAGIVQLFVEP